MKIAIICPANMLYMPYVSNFEKIISENEISFEIINWDRFQIEETTNKNKFRDNKIGHHRNYLDYLKFKKFILKRLKLTNYDKIIVFGIQLSYFLSKFLLKYYKDKYVIDIRDHNKIINFFKIKKVIDNSDFTVISSPGFKKWLPSSNKYIINHNSNISFLDDSKQINSTFKNQIISISYIGALRDYYININLINSLKNNGQFVINFNGEGAINKDIEIYLKSNNINNVFLTGMYRKEDEDDFYINSDFINVMIPNNDINSQTLLPNRLYKAAFYAKPVLSFEGTYVSSLIKKYKLGLVLESFEKIDLQIKRYLNEFNLDEYEKGRISFLNKVIKDNEYFKAKIENYIRK